MKEEKECVDVCIQNSLYLSGLNPHSPVMHAVGNSYASAMKDKPKKISFEIIFKTKRKSI